jgi:hypothetical protein
MAMHRQLVEAETPAELLKFKPEEWESPDDSGWWPAFERWKTARRGWIAQHPKSALGNLLTLMIVEHQTHMAMCVCGGSRSDGAAVCARA